jgi:hypothetical protein
MYTAACRQQKGQLSNTPDSSRHIWSKDGLPLPAPPMQMMQNTSVSNQHGLTQVALAPGVPTFVQSPAMYAEALNVADAPRVVNMGMVYAQQHHQQPLQYVQLPNGTFAVYNAPVVLDQMNLQFRSDGDAIQHGQAIPAQPGHGILGFQQVYHGHVEGSFDASCRPQSFHMGSNSR